VNSVRLSVNARGKHYVASSNVPEVTAIGTTPTEAAENGRKAAVAMLRAAGKSLGRPTFLIVDVKDRAVSTIIMQPIDYAVSLVVAEHAPKWRYMASVAISSKATE
jgi:hypothetical protein